jgi:CBS domain-containing protein
VRLADCVAADRLAVPLRSSTLPEAAEELVELLAASGRIASIEKLRQRMAEERAEDIVTLGDRAFLLHYRTDVVEDILVALGTSPQPICRQFGDGEPQCARIVLVIVAPPRMAARYLQIVGAFARLLARPERVAEILTQPDARALASLPALAEWDIPEQIMVRDIMTDTPRTVGPDTSLRDAARLMARTGVSALPVVDEAGQLIGLLGDRELLREFLAHFQHKPPAARAQGMLAADRTVREAMTRKVLGVSPEQPLVDVASLMINKDVDHVPVVREGKLVGFLSRGDIVRKLLGT